MIAYYPFEDNAADASGNANHGEIIGNVTFESGITGSAARFHGNNNSNITLGYIRVVSDQLDMLDSSGGDGWTITAWLKQAQRSSGGVWDKHKGWGSGFQSLFNHTDKLSFWWEDYPSYGGGGVNEPIPVDEWIWVAYVLEDKTLKLYIDGELKDSVSTNTSATYANPLEHFYIGSRGNADRDSLQSGVVSFIGLLDEMRIYSRALSVDELGEL